MTIKETLNAIRRAIGDCTAPERELMEELEAEAEGWKMRLQELEADDDDQ